MFYREGGKSKGRTIADLVERVQTLEQAYQALTGLLIGWGLYALLKSLIAIPIKAVGQKNKKG